MIFKVRKIDAGTRGRDVYLGMSPIQNGGSYLMYQHASVKVAKWLQTGTIKGHELAYFKVLHATMFPNATWTQV